MHSLRLVGGHSTTSKDPTPNGGMYTHSSVWVPDCLADDAVPRPNLFNPDWNKTHNHTKNTPFIAAVIQAVSAMVVRKYRVLCTHL
jgi:hypothetical protein